MNINILVILLFCGLRNAEASDDIVFLTNNSTKSWALQLNEKLNPCTTASVLADNTYIFSIDGQFQFDHGAAKENPACVGEDCCNDLVNITGKWEFTKGGKGLRITAEYETGNLANRMELTLIDGMIEHLDHEILRLSQVDAENGITETFEFRSIH